MLENTGMNKIETFSALMELIVQEKEMTINISIITLIQWHYLIYRPYADFIDCLIKVLLLV